MSRRTAWFGLSFGLVLPLFLTVRAAAVAPVMKDDGKFFSPEAVKKANDDIRDLARKTGMDLLIETFPTVPDNQTEKVKAMSTGEREKFFEKWANERADQEAVNGVYVLICREPGHIQVVLRGKESSRFGEQNRNKLVPILLAKFREKKFDEGLAEAVKFVREKVMPASTKPS